MGKKKRAKRDLPRMEVTAEEYAGLLAITGVAFLNLLERVEGRTDDPEMVRSCQVLRSVVVAETLNASVAAATGVNQ
jgi:hypothetical protein